MRSFRSILSRAAGALALVLATASGAAAIPNAMSYQGVVLDQDGLPAEGPVEIEVEFWNQENGSGVLYGAQTFSNVTLVDGVFDIQLEYPALGDTFDGSDLWMKVLVDGQVLSPNQRIVAVPYAFRAAVADRVEGELSATNIFLSGSGAGLESAPLRVENPASDAYAGSFLGRTHFETGADQGRGRTVEMLGIGRYSNNPVLYVENTSTSTYTQAAKFVNNSNSPTGVFVNNGTGNAVYVWANGNQYWDAALKVTNPNTNGGISGYFTNNSGNATMHVQNESNGWVMYLQGNGGHFIQGVDSDWNTKFWIDGTGMAHVRALEILGGADLSERFDVRTEPEVTVEPGTVVTIDPDDPSGALIPSDGAYSRRVAGIVAGAGGIEPGMLMGQQGQPAVDGAHPVALTGRVYAKADTSNGPIRPGDLLTTSARAGHAMKATDWERSQGAVIGKSLGSLDEESGLVLVLVGLQ